MTTPNNLTAEEKDIQEYLNETRESVNASDSANGTHKHSVKSSTNKIKQDAIDELKKCGYRTPPILVEQLLSNLFIDHRTNPGHWLYIAQHYHPRAINWVINGMIKAHKYGWQTIKNPPGYFTDTLKKYYKQRKSQRKLKIDS